MGRDSQQLEQFIASWPDTGSCRQSFMELKGFMEQLEGADLEFIPRPGVTYSLRGMRKSAEQRALFALVDVIEDDPRWLSVCFFASAVSDPESIGEMVPGGLLGKDGYCFDFTEHSDSLLDYLKERIEEALSGGRCS